MKEYRLYKNYRGRTAREGDFKTIQDAEAIILPKGYVQCFYDDLDYKPGDVYYEIWEVDTEGNKDNNSSPKYYKKDISKTPTTRKR